MPSPRGAIHWVRYDPAGVMLLVLRLSAAAELAHRRLADAYWQSGNWTDPGPAAAALSRAPLKAWPGILAELHQVGWRVIGRKLRNPAITRVRSEAVGFIRVARQNGRSGAEHRWSPRARRGRSQPPASPKPPDSDPMATLCPPHGDPMATPMPTIKYSNSNSDNALNSSELKQRSSSERKTAVSGEKAFLEDVASVLALDGKKHGRDQLENWGGWWRNRYRENPDKARRVLSEVAGMARERRIHSSTGGAAFDLWKRLP